MERNRYTLTPQMRDYDTFTDPSEFRYVPYLMNFHRTDYRSPVVNTDELGFRWSCGSDGSVGSIAQRPAGTVNLLAGSSTAFGLGSTCDATTVASRLWQIQGRPWLNFAGRGYNSTQELMLFVLYHHLVGNVTDIVLLSGVNNLALSRLPSDQRGDHGAFHFCGEYFEKMNELLEERRPRPQRSAILRRRRARSKTQAGTSDTQPPLDEAIARAVDLTTRHLEVWRILAAVSGARLSFVLQPFASWVRDQGCPEEEILFRELDDLSEIPYEKLYGNIVPAAAGRKYAAALRTSCDATGVRFVDLNPVMAEEIDPDQWVFIDRRHFTDEGSAVVASLLAREFDFAQTSPNPTVTAERMNQI